MALTLETFTVLGLPGTLNWYIWLAGLSTFFIYNLHYYKKISGGKEHNRLQWGLRHRRFQLYSIIGSLLLMLGGIITHHTQIFFYNGRLHYSSLTGFFIIAILSLAYSHPFTQRKKKTLRQIGWLKMVTLSFVWSFATSILPVLMLPPDVQATDTVLLLSLFSHRFFFIASLAILFNVYDYREDKEENIRTIAVIAGPAKTLHYCKWVMLLLNTVAALWLIMQMADIHWPVNIALAIPIMVLWWLYHFFRQGNTEADFYLRHDGLMLVKALLLIFATRIIYC